MMGHLVTWDVLLNFRKGLPFETARKLGFQFRYVKLVGPFCRKVLMEITFIQI